MKEDSKNKRKSVRIPCAEIVHQYTMATLQRLGNLRCTDIYRSMKQGGVIVFNREGKEVDTIEKLIVCADSFIPSVPMTSEDVEKSKKFVASWKRHLQHIRKQLVGTCKPIYLQTEVARVLKERGSKVKFREVMLEWYLSRFGGDNMTPEKVADAVIAHDATDWGKVKPLAKGKKGYNIRLDVNTEKEKAVARKYVQWIYKIETGDIPTTLLDDLKNDMKVVREFEAWRDGDPKNYEYKNTYKEFVSRLRTAPVAEKPDIKEEVPKDNNTHFLRVDGVKQQVSPIRVQTPSADEGLGEERDPFTPQEDDYAMEPEEPEYLKEGTYQQNYDTVVGFLQELAKDDIAAKEKIKNAEEKIIRYSELEDFTRLFNELRTRSIKEDVGHPLSYAIQMIINSL